MPLSFEASKVYARLLSGVPPASPDACPGKKFVFREGVSHRLVVRDHAAEDAGKLEDGILRHERWRHPQGRPTGRSWGRSRSRA